ncbi:LacI family DNA-binding transcriptional regulator [Sphingobium sp. WCS2017Hpa-17]|uniref:LacI family DNA-binding transcriptional regulator n=1 Tax=Sphingobium sp. WCS2017Hpa-17 TaxID=3073638 RepID=UPI00288C1F6A|nr:LacI family DNA-binding transcriptional regulator [Sphingobium sp. WCS2017Hpa-17]
MSVPAKRSDASGRPTMAMVAELAGVSKITVSRALNGSALVRPEVREKIASVAREVGYRMNSAARSLRTRRSQTIAMVIERLVAGDRPISDPLLLSMIGGLLESLTPAGYAMLLTTSDHYLDHNAIDADGIVMLGQGIKGERVKPIASSGLPLVIWGAVSAANGLPVIGSDNREGGRLAAAHLVERGRQRLLFLGDPLHPEVGERQEGVRDVVAATTAALVGSIACEFSRAAGAAAVQQALDDGLAFDAIIAASDFIAAGACDALIDRNIRVPDEIAITGFDDIAVAASNRPPLTTVRQDWSAAGRLLGKTILQLVAGEETICSTTVLPVELIVRQSS